MAAIDCPIPIIDFKEWAATTPEQKSEIVSQISDACREIGFFMIKNHGVDQDVIDTMMIKTKDFFDLSVDAKEAYTSQDEEKYPYGYVGFLKETLRSGMEEEASKGATSSLAADELAAKTVKEASPDLKECMSMGPYNPASGLPAPQLPIEPEGFSGAWMGYYKAMEGLADDLLQAFALALNQEANWFKNKTDKHRCALRALNYPDLDTAPAAGQLRASPHTDYGTLTILMPDDAPGGLQVKGKDGAWLPVPFMPGHFVINIGDLMQRWTNDQWVSTIHRVVPPTQAEVDARDSCRRQSVAFFHNVNADVLVEAISSTVDEAHPAKYPTITAFEHLMEKHLAAVGHKK